MVGEARDVAFVGGVDDLVGVERHEVVVLVLVVGARASLELEVIQHLAHVLDYELTPEKQEIRQMHELNVCIAQNDEPLSVHHCAVKHSNRCSTLYTPHLVFYGLPDAYFTHHKLWF